MNRLDRTMGILLLLRGGASVSATDLSRRFEVSVRTIYRDVEVLSGLGVPIYAEMGRRGASSSATAISLLLGLILMRRLRVIPFPAETDFAERKLLAALPEGTRQLMARAPRIIGFEKVPPDLLHAEPDDPLAAPRGEAEKAEAAIVGRFLRAILARSRVWLRYRSPYRVEEPAREGDPEAAASLVRWLGPGAELLEPRAWRPLVASGLRSLLAAHEGG